MPSTSRIVVQRDDEGIRITETLRARRSTIYALIVAVIALIALMSQGWVIYQNSTAQSNIPAAEAILAVLWLSEFVVMLLVINSTWGRTLLTAQDGTIRLDFRRPFAKRRHEWAFDQVLDLGVERTLEEAYLDPRRELSFRVAGGQTVHLFTDHPEKELEEISAVIHDTMERRLAAARRAPGGPALGPSLFTE